MSATIPAAELEVGDTLAGIKGGLVRRISDLAYGRLRIHYTDALAHNGIAHQYLDAGDDVTITNR